MNQKIDQITENIVLILRSLSIIIKKDDNFKTKEDWVNTLQGFKDDLEPYTEIIIDDEV